MSEYDINRISYQRTHLLHSVPLPSAKPLTSAMLRGYNFPKYFKHAEIRFNEEWQEGIHHRAINGNWNKDNYKYMVVASYSVEYLMREMFLGKPKIKHRIISAVGSFFDEWCHDVAYRLAEIKHIPNTFEIEMRRNGLSVSTYLIIN